MDNHIPETNDAITEERPAKRPRVTEPTAEHVPIPMSTPQDAGDISEEEEEEIGWGRQSEATKASDLYLDTINRAVLDFDFEKVCSVSLSNINIYGCLVCGKYFQGRGRNSYAYAHSIHDDHHVFINLETTKVYVLPDGYPVADPSLDDIAFVLSPTFTKNTVVDLSSPVHLSKPSFDLSSKPYIPGYIGLNDIKRNDYMNVIIHSLLHVAPLRDYLLLSNFRGKESELLKRFAGLAKKVWNPRLFKSQVSPHELLQEVGRASGGKFSLEKQGDPVEFLTWLLHRLHKDVGGSKRKNSSKQNPAARASLLKTTMIQASSMRHSKERFAWKPSKLSSALTSTETNLDSISTEDAIEKNIIPQVSIQSVLSKYDGRATQESAGEVRRFKCSQLPQYVILHFKRFTKSNFVEEKNPTIVNFPLRGVDFRDCEDTCLSHLIRLSLISRYPHSLGLPDLDAPPSNTQTVYDLIANVTHESAAGTTRDKESTVWKVHLRAGSGGGEHEKWFQIQDLIVDEIRKEMIFLGETVLQIWERRSPASPRSETVPQKAASTV
ncbi:hypothetical protein EUX98_g9075 [Antrodiella citrinella]|uniref:USP domain-containing protein n=1 Tax=Antrodiella citrinella TaxID=2447956 RepID=A0A4S4M4C4_9APHY|nr:hypothetical protein EUX98_g9075 [Antrodiella citrinella]